MELVGGRASNVAGKASVSQADPSRRGGRRSELMFWKHGRTELKRFKVIPIRPEWLLLRGGDEEAPHMPSRLEVTAVP